VYVLPYAQLKISKLSEEDVVDIDFAGGISIQTYLIGIPICLPPSNNAPVSNISGAINEGIESNVQMCLEIGNVMSDSVSESVSIYYSPSAPSQYTQSESISTSVSIYSSPSAP
jgi:hypothetical protein